MASDEDKTPIRALSLVQARRVSRDIANPVPKIIAINTVVLRQGTKPESVSLLHSGVVKLAYTDTRGRETLLGLRSRGWWISAWLALADVPSFWSVKAVTGCSVITYSVADFASLLGGDSEMKVALIASQSRELVSLLKHIVDLKELSDAT